MLLSGTVPVAGCPHVLWKGVTSSLVVVLSSPSGLCLSRSEVYQAAIRAADSMEQPPPTDVSVVIPTWNSSRTVSSCLSSLRPPYNEPREVIVVDRKSSDQTQEICRRLSARRAAVQPDSPGLQPRKPGTSYSWTQTKRQPQVFYGTA
jgi:Glycosyl transferase family 2